MKHIIVFEIFFGFSEYLSNPGAWQKPRATEHLLKLQLVEIEGTLRTPQNWQQRSVNQLLGNWGELSCAPSKLQHGSF